MAQTGMTRHSIRQRLKDSKDLPINYKHKVEKQMLRVINGHKERILHTYSMADAIHTDCIPDL